MIMFDVYLHELMEPNLSNVNYIKLHVYSTALKRI